MFKLVLSTRRFFDLQGMKTNGSSVKPACSKVDNDNGFCAHEKRENDKIYPCQNYDKSGASGFTLPWHGLTRFFKSNQKDSPDEELGRSSQHKNMVDKDNFTRTFNVLNNMKSRGLYLLCLGDADMCKNKDKPGYSSLYTALFCAFLSLNPGTAFPGERAYVSRNGSDSNSCTQAAPCSTFQRAITLAGTDGEVLCIDSGFFGSVNITASVSIMCEHNVGQLGATINSINLPANNIVILNGIVIDERNFGGNALTFSGQGTLIIHNSTIKNATNSVNFVPNGSAKLIITNSTFEDSTNAGVFIEPMAVGTYRVDMDGVKAINDKGGIAILASAGKRVFADIRNSLIAQNSSYGVLSSISSTGENQVLIDSSSISNNGWGIRSTGAKSFVQVNSSVLLRNNVGFSAASSGSILSYGNNAVNSISATGGATGTIGLQ